MSRRIDAGLAVRAADAAADLAVRAAGVVYALRTGGAARLVANHVGEGTAEPVCRVGARGKLIATNVAANVLGIAALPVQDGLSRLAALTLNTDLTRTAAVVSAGYLVAGASARAVRKTTVDIVAATNVIAKGSRTRTAEVTTLEAETIVADTAGCEEPAGVGKTSASGQITSRHTNAPLGEGKGNASA
ncbi:MAG: hypothetical protein JOY54_00350 [Acidobacteriaceae bacterium]|nr:hypothetical protein [Acidobacteriaceae bacterium]